MAQIFDNITPELLPALHQLLEAAERSDSPGDADVTRKHKAAGECPGIQLLDHIIFNRSGYFSF
jgi:hypothetical protein